MTKKHLLPSKTTADSVSFPIRMPRSLHQQIALSAERSEHSNNREAVLRLQRSFSQPNTLNEILLQGLGLQKHQRIVSTTQEQDVSRLFLILESLPIDKLCLAARRNTTAGAVLVIFVQSRELSLIMDSTHLNASTYEGHELVMDLLSNIERLGLRPLVHQADDYVPDTRAMDAFDAIECVLACASVKKGGSLRKLILQLKN